MEPTTREWEPVNLFSGGRLFTASVLQLEV